MLQDGFQHNRLRLDWNWQNNKNPAVKLIPNLFITDLTFEDPWLSKTTWIFPSFDLGFICFQLVTSPVKISLMGIIPVSFYRNLICLQQMQQHPMQFV